MRPGSERISPPAVLKLLIFNDERPGVVQGSCEVRVPTDEVVRAEELLAAYDPDSPDLADPSPELDMVTLTERMGATAEMEVIAMKSILDDAGIGSVIIGRFGAPKLQFSTPCGASERGSKLDRCWPKLRRPAQQRRRKLSDCRS